jgi:hypothetical protein
MDPELVNVFLADLPGLAAISENFV